jgi:hypothetical protein
MGLRACFPSGAARQRLEMRSCSGSNAFACCVSLNRWGRVVPVERIELPTFGLQNRCSTAELNRLKAIDGIGVTHLADGGLRRDARVCLWPRAGPRQPAHPAQSRFRAVVLPHDSAIVRVLRGGAVSANL